MKKLLLFTLILFWATACIQKDYGGHGLYLIKNDSHFKIKAVIKQKIYSPPDDIDTSSVILPNQLDTILKIAFIGSNATLRKLNSLEIYKVEEEKEPWTLIYRQEPIDEKK